MSDLGGVHQVHLLLQKLLKAFPQWHLMRSQAKALLLLAWRVLARVTAGTPGAALSGLGHVSGSCELTADQGVVAHLLSSSVLRTCMKGGTPATAATFPAQPDSKVKQCSPQVPLSSPLLRWGLLLPSGACWGQKVLPLPASFEGSWPGQRGGVRGQSSSGTPSVLLQPRCLLTATLYRKQSCCSQRARSSSESTVKWLGRWGAGAGCRPLANCHSPHPAAPSSHLTGLRGSWAGPT